MSHYPWHALVTCICVNCALFSWVPSRNQSLPTLEVHSTLAVFLCGLHHFLPILTICLIFPHPLMEIYIKMRSVSDFCLVFLPFNKYLLDEWEQEPKLPFQSPDWLWPCCFIVLSAQWQYLTQEECLRWYHCRVKLISVSSLFKIFKYF